MARATGKLYSKSLLKWMRILHRDIGCFIVGMSLVYGISGIILNHMGNTDPAYSVKKVSGHLPSNISNQEILTLWKTKEWNAELIRVIPGDNEKMNLILKAGHGHYNMDTGEVYFEVFKKRPFVDFINRLHYNREQGWSFFADFFAGSLIFLAVSGLFLVRGKNGFFSRGIWIMLTGMIVLVSFYFIRN